MKKTTKRCRKHAWTMVRTWGDWYRGIPTQAVQHRCTECGKTMVIKDKPFGA